MDSLSATMSLIPLGLVVSLGVLYLTSSTERISGGYYRGDSKVLRNPSMNKSFPDRYWGADAYFGFV